MCVAGWLFVFQLFHSVICWMADSYQLIGLEAISFIFFSFLLITGMLSTTSLRPDLNSMW